LLPTSQGCLAYHSLAVFSVQRAGWARAAPASIRTIRNDFISHDDNVRRGNPGVLNRFGETTNGQPVPLGKPWDRKPNSGKGRRKLVSVRGLRRISGQLSPKRLSPRNPHAVR